MFTFLKALFAILFSIKISLHTGAIPDPRTPDQKDEDYLHEERLPGSPAIDPFGFAKLLESPYPYLNQQGTSACVPHAVGTAGAIERELDGGVYISPAPMLGYRLRSNYPAEGTYPPEEFGIIANVGLPPAASFPTPATEAQANAMVITPAVLNEAAPFKGKHYFTFGIPNDIDEIAKVAAAGHAVPICIYATYAEYAQTYPKILVPALVQGSAQAAISHCICVLPKSGFIENGTKYVCIMDSAWFGGFKFRYISEDFIKQRCYSAGYWDTVASIGGGTRPHFHFSKTLAVGSPEAAEIKQMQLLLISENLLASDCATGVFGGLTLAAVRDFQQKYTADILTPADLTAPTSTWGPKCISKANALCA